MKAPALPVESPEASKAARALLRLSVADLERIADDWEGFATASGYPTDSDELRRAWTEPLGDWTAGAIVKLLAPSPIFVVRWLATDEEESSSVEALTVQVLTNELGILLLSSTDPFLDTGLIVGFVARDDVTRSSALLLREASFAIPSDLLELDVESNLPWWEVVRLLWASQKHHAARIVTMTQAEIELQYFGEHPNGGLRILAPGTLARSDASA